MAIKNPVSSWRPGAAGPRQAMLACLILTTPAAARAADWLQFVKAGHPYVALGLAHDSNLLRQPDSAVSDQKSDRYATLEAGLAAQLDVSLQRFLIDGRVYRINYDHYDQFNHFGGDARAVWQWALGSDWTGDIGYRFDRKLRDFANQIVPQFDMINRHRVFGSIEHMLAERWRVGLGGELADLSFSQSAALDKRKAAATGKFEYVSRAGNSLGLEAQYLDARFRKAEQRDFEETRLLPTVEWHSSVKLSFRGQAGYVWRKHESPAEQDYSGFVGRLSSAWRASDRTSLKTAVWRDISNLQDETAEYAVITGVSLEPSWQIAPSLTLRALAAYEERDFRATATDPLADRVDKLGWGELWLDWSIRPTVVLGVGGHLERRDSSREIEDYDYDTVSVRLKIGI